MKVNYLSYLIKTVHVLLLIVVFVSCKKSIKTPQVDKDSLPVDKEVKTVKDKGISTDKQVVKVDNNKNAVDEVKVENIAKVEKLKKPIVSIKDIYRGSGWDDEDGVSYPKFLGTYKEKVRDFNKDGVKDTLFYFSDNGSGYGGYSIGIFDGKTKKHFLTSNEKSYYSSYSKIYLPKNINKSFLRVLKRQVFKGLKKSNKISSSLEWILSSYSHKNTTKANNFFDVYVTPKTTFKSLKGVNSMAEYYVPVKSDELTPFLDVISNKSKDVSEYIFHSNYLNVSENKGELIVKTKFGDVYKNSCSVYLKKEGSLKYLYANDLEIFDVNQNQGSSVKEVLFSNDKYLLVTVVFGTNSHYLFLINLENDLCALVKDSFCSIDLEYMSLEKWYSSNQSKVKSLEVEFDELQN